MRCTTGLLALPLLVLLGGCAAGQTPGPAEPVAATPPPPAVVTSAPSAAVTSPPSAALSPPSPTTQAPASSSAEPSTSPTSTPTPTPAPCPEDAAIDSVTWTEAEGGRSLAVVPTEQLRDCAGPLTRWDGIPPGWAEVLDLAGAEADSPAMEQQYACHLRFARAKHSWNLEPWRPAVDEQELILARCNP